MMLVSFFLSSSLSGVTYISVAMDDSRSICKFDKFEQNSDKQLSSMLVSCCIVELLNLTHNKLETIVFSLHLATSMTMHCMLHIT